MEGQAEGALAGEEQGATSTPRPLGSRVWLVPNLRRFS